MSDSLKRTIVERRTNKRSLTKPVPLEVIYHLLEQASFAPFHKQEPWQAKIVTTVVEKDFLYERVIASYHRLGLIHNQATEEKFTTKMTRLIKEAPATILFARQVMVDNPRLDSDSVQATAALIQNFSLLAWEEDLVGFWATSPFVLDEILTQELGFPSNYQLMANYRLGYRDHMLPQHLAKRQPVTTWAAPLLPTKTEP